MRSVFRGLVRLGISGAVLTASPLLAQPALDAQANPASGAEASAGAPFQAALERLKAADPAERAIAADEMGRRGYRLRHEIAQVLRPMLISDPEPLVRAAAGRALGRLGVREAIPELMGALADTSPEVRVVAAAALWRLPDPQAVEPLLRRTTDSESAVREWAAQALGVIGDPRAVTELIRLLSDPVREVRVAAVLSLGRIGDPAGLLPLRNYLADGVRDEEEKEEVVHAIAKVKSPEKIEVLFALLRTGRGDPTHMARVISALGQVGDAADVSRIKPYAQAGEPSQVRKAAKQALSTLARRHESRSSPEGAQAP